MAYAAPLTVVASAARTTTGNSGALALPDAGGNLILNVHVTAASGVSPTLDLKVKWSHDSTNFADVEGTAASGVSPTLDLKVKWSHDGTNFADVEGTADTFAQITAAKETIKSFAIKAPHYRVEWTIAGTTPSFTFSVQAYVTA